MRDLELPGEVDSCLDRILQPPSSVPLDVPGCPIRGNRHQRTAKNSPYLVVPGTALAEYNCLGAYVKPGCADGRTRAGKVYDTLA